MKSQRFGFRLPLVARLVVWIAILMLYGTGIAKSVFQVSEPARLIASLEKKDPQYLFDMHGNADRDLQRLMILRFEATGAVEAAIDRLEINPKKAKLVVALYQVLGFVKDPASVDWIRKKLQTKNAQAIYDYYLPKWRSWSFDGYGSWEWLTGREQWIDLWIRTFGSETSIDRRATLISILSGFDDPPVTRFFLARRTSMFDPKEILLVESYLYEHDKQVDGKRIAAAIKALSRYPKNRELLVGTADALRHQAFIPYLISTLDVLEGNVFPGQYRSQDVLQDITFELAIHGKKEWNAWYSRHGREGRGTWLQRALNSFRQRLAQNPVAAEKWFVKAVYRWNDIAVLPFIRSDLLPRPIFHSDIAGWINLTYSAHYRARLKPIADEIARHPERLEDWARELLKKRRFIPGHSFDTWTRYVQMSNMRV